MKSIFSFQQPHQHYLDIEFIVDSLQSEFIEVQLPAWRPGRYELGNFAKNIQKWNVVDENGNALHYEKISKDCWRVATKGISSVHIQYNYYANELNAGSTYLDETQLYVNPVNCCLYIPNRIDEAYTVVLNLPEEYHVACALPQQAFANGKLLTASSFHELADSPFIAGSRIQQDSITIQGIDFHFWFQGECRIDWKKLKLDFSKFIECQLLMMKTPPFTHYHFIFQIVPYRMYHGVEHLNSTVIALGPGYNLMKAGLYEDLLGVSCHELFHAWNIKAIRPADMYPYNYSKENYSKLGYVYEGVTTYYGDLLLCKSYVFSEEQYFITLQERLQKHLYNFGALNHSVSDSSFDTWLDGYVPGIPNRKTSIYDEGCVLAFITDIFIRNNSANKNSLDQVMVHLYNEFALKSKGYTENDYAGIIEHYANASFSEIMNGFIKKAASYRSLLVEALDYIGCELVETASSKYHEHALGIKVSESTGICRITAVYPGSVADIAGISLNDEIIGINKIALVPNSGSFTEWCNYFADQPMVLVIASNYKLKQIQLQPLPFKFYKYISIQKLKDAAVYQKSNYHLWCGHAF